MAVCEVFLLTTIKKAQASMGPFLLELFKGY